ncbi:hypothetical protein GALMADRAFT_578492 [Galerina marginata CBS 339.88]|uniref:Uncharacterized protein n=1 Tax=Galerina marginata (strain CBS 339.88) TaxID=685588 RepID=A0A067T319_GALM3|nr:hypothetical protein GALMADRAFT_578492 [Galerina marginata CBS 339.88]
MFLVMHTTYWRLDPRSFTSRQQWRWIPRIMRGMKNLRNRCFHPLRICLASVFNMVSCQRTAFFNRFFVRQQATGEDKETNTVGGVGGIRNVSAMVDNNSHRNPLCSTLTFYC